jgi:2-methylcitrate dehydratase PrpD
MVTPAPETPTRVLARHVAGLRYEDLPSPVVEKAKMLVLDLFGVALRAAADADSTPSVREAVGRLARPGRASCIGLGDRLSAQFAALMNGTLAHSLDFDDTFRDGSIHPGAAIIPTAFALAEENDRGGRDLVAAIVAGYDVTCRLSVAVDAKSHYDRGFHPTGTVGVFGASAAGARMLGLDADTLENAFGINGSQAAASLQFFENGAWNKRTHPGFAAANAILALELARSGFLGASRPIEGPQGFLHGYSDRAHPEELTAELGRRYDILRTAFKPYPACRYGHPVLDALIEIMNANDLRPQDVEHLRIGLCDAGVDLIGEPVDRKRDPKNTVDGQFSMHFVAAVAMTRRRMAWADYELVGDPGISDLMRRIDVFRDPASNAVFPGRWESSLELKARGRTFTDRRWETRGEPERPLSWADVEAKFDDLASAILAGPQRRAVIDLVHDLERLGDMAALGTAVRAGTTAARALAG